MFLPLDEATHPTWRIDLLNKHTIHKDVPTAAFKPDGHLWRQPRKKEHPHHIPVFGVLYDTHQDYRVGYNHTPEGKPITRMPIDWMEHSVKIDLNKGSQGFLNGAPSDYAMSPYYMDLRAIVL